ncbi:hypothetical protein NP493_3022g00003 [Ridgeia piscesae]|uniref:Fucolectin tachylectin-4 pentraxin-1 domain-containing protein n=1 Tax=Ridgeia piscesae TaxID=27915 RepID=A0AAD9JA14_RIDPI|nr:hypothetical protein NP493_3022g00003 [Ridgeia piscesae]
MDRQTARNVAYNKAASQSIGDWGGTFPAGRAVDGNTNPDMGAGHCALPDTDWGKNAWWMVDLKDTYNFSRVIIYNRDSEACSNCPSTSTCNDVIGCGRCDPGKQQPDCTTGMFCYSDHNVYNMHSFEIIISFLLN